MKIFILMSWRNLWRYKQRSLIVISTIAIGISAMIICTGFINGFNAQLVENSINTSLGHIAIHEKGFQKDMRLEYNFRVDKGLYNAIKNTPSVIAYAPRIKIQGMIRSSEASRGVMIVGIDPEKEKNVSQIASYTLKKDGSDFLNDPADDSILISKLLAEKLDVTLGDKVVLMFENHKSEIIGVGLRIKGFFVTPIDGIDKYMVYVGLNKMQQITGLNDNISEINIITKNINSVDITKQELMSMIKNDALEILTWQDMAPHMVRMITLADNVILIFMVIIFITVIFTIINTMIMAIMERFHEIGVMKSIGTRPSKIFAMILFEAANLGLVGLCAGIMFSVSIVYIASITGLDLSMYSDNLKSWGTGSIIYPSLRLKDIGNSILVVIITTFIGSLYPAVKAALIKPLDALHFI